jgi:hypothetical protein
MDPGPEPETASGQGQSLTRSRAIEVRRKDVVEVEQWAELRRLHFVEGVSIRELIWTCVPSMTIGGDSCRMRSPP